MKMPDDDPRAATALAALETTRAGRARVRAVVRRLDPANTAGRDRRPAAAAALPRIGAADTLARVLARVPDLAMLLRLLSWQWYDHGVPLPVWGPETPGVRRLRAEDSPFGASRLVSWDTRAAEPARHRYLIAYDGRVLGGRSGFVVWRHAQVLDD